MPDEDDITERINLQLIHAEIDRMQQRLEVLEHAAVDMRNELRKVKEKLK